MPHRLVVRASATACRELSNRLIPQPCDSIACAESRYDRGQEVERTKP